MIGFRRPSPRCRHVLLGMVTCVVLALVPSAAALAHDHGDYGNHHRGHHHGGALFVSPNGAADNGDYSCDTAGYTTIQSAVDAAPSGGEVVVCAGTYTEDVVITQPLKLVGLDGATIQGAPTNTAMCDQLGATGPGSAPCLAAVTIKSSDVKISGFTVTGALGEGILATGSLAGGSISDVQITDNHVTGNDLGAAQSPNSPYPQCNGMDEVPGDCGEGIHLMGAYDSQVSGNESDGNSGGILLTDEFGPTHDNLIVHNDVHDNLVDCGITVPGHNPFALDASGNRQPAVAGDYRNLIAYNKITGNGVQGEGAGVLFANATAGTASYDNLVIHNYIAGNEMAGVTMHAHPIDAGQFEDLNGNRIIENAIGRNNVGGDPDASVTDTTGVLVLGAVPVKVTIARNAIFNDHFGVWLGTGGNVTAKIRHNQFFNVDIPVFTQS